MVFAALTGGIPVPAQAPTDAVPERVVLETDHVRVVLSREGRGHATELTFKDAGAATALANAIASVQCGYGNTVPLQFELDPGFANQSESVANMKALIRGFCEMGGTLLNINILNREQLLEAHVDPEKHPDLIVRVTGFSAYFRMLSKEFRQLVVDRVITQS